MKFLEYMKKSWILWLSFMLALAFVLVLHGAVPFLSAPTLGQAVWTTGFSQSFINQSLFSIYATNFGAPQPAPIAFGLAGAYPAGLFIAAGMHAVDAYSTTAFFWLALAFWGAWRLGVFMGIPSLFSLLGAVLWMSMPMIWAHAGYSMLSLGIGLLPFYFLSTAYLLFQKFEKISSKVFMAAIFVSACQIAVFMDGYSFMMFAVGSGILAGWVFFHFHELRRQALFYAFPVLVLGFGLAYLLYKAYIGKAQFEPAPLDFFRGWGADLTFWAAPTYGLHWLWDTLGLSIRRSSREFFGDASVWITTFSLPLIIAGLVSWWRCRKHNILATGFLLVALAGFYMALGPSLKINSTRPPEMILSGQLTPIMSSEHAVFPTGNGYLSEKIPGFRNMRAAYRWSALGIFGVWGLVALMLPSLKGRVSVWVVTLFLFLIVSNLPNMSNKLQQNKFYRAQFIQLDRDLVSDIKQLTEKGDLVAFLPYRNDFLINYLASRVGILTYNIGGDKNLFNARKYWPYTMRCFKMNSIDMNFVDRALMLLARQEANVVILSFIDTLFGAQEWPVAPRYKSDLDSVIQELSQSGFVDIETTDYFATIRIKKDFHGLLQAGQMEQHLVRQGYLDVDSLSAKNFLPSQIMSQVGEVQNGRLYSNGRSGFLHFGPYRPMQTGKYRFIVRGEVTQAKSAWADVVSGLGSVVHGRFKLLDLAAEENDFLVDELLILQQPVEDLEVRIYVGSEDRVRIDSFELQRVFVKTDI